MKMDKTIEKIQKLLSLSLDESNENEARLAAKMAGEMMAKYQISMDKVMTDKQASIWEKAEDGKNTLWEPALATSVARVFDAEIVVQPIARTRSKLIFVGSKKDVDYSIHYFTYLRNKLEAEAKIAVKLVTGDEAEIKNDYCQGMVIIIAERLADMYTKKNEYIQENCPESTALAKLKNEQLESYLKAKYDQAEEQKPEDMIPDKRDQAFMNGLRDGQFVLLSRPLGKNKPKRAIH